tara:strand:+ start:268 stop:531 length:264 start_codon:yes stop_codon:yes gene_type:complete
MTQTKLNLSDVRTDYNGWTDWTTWNCALWINNDESFYNIAKLCKTYTEFLIEMVEIGVYPHATPDGADWGEADLTEMQELIESISVC